ncbi:ethanolamine permease [Hypericibacter sp.]|uniref:ethanolamine permease n=1 Tax=Hypericibacter sp. TaxID=2705401 RepID=UPI003D6CC67D
MPTGEHLQGVSYEKVGAEYFEKRKLRRYAGVWSLWALGVGAVISGDFFGWNYGLATGGFGGLLVATIIVTVMYVTLCYSLAEMSPALPHTGGAYSFARTTMGPWGGFLTGLGENMEYVITPGVIIVSVGAYLQTIFNTPPELTWVWWVAVFAIFVGLNIWGVELSFKFTVFITFVAMAILVFFFIAALTVMDYHTNALNIPPTEGNTAFMPFGWTGVFASLPFAIWFLLAIEQLPLAAEESADPKRDMPKGLLWGILTLVILGFLTLYFNSVVPPGAQALGGSAQPLLDGLIGIFGEGIGTKFLALLAVAGLIASFHTIIFAYGRNIFSLSRAGYFPRWLSITHGQRHTPHVALIVGGAVSLGLALLMNFAFGMASFVGAALLNLAVFGAVISYSMQGLSYIMLRIKFPNIERPYRSPLGSLGAAVCTIIALVCLISMFLNEAYRPGLYGAVVWYALGVIYFAFIGRHKLVLSPEEEFALKATHKAAE